MTQNETVFDLILAGKIKAKLAFESDDVLAFHDISPQAPLHVLVIPKRKLRRLSDLADEKTSEDLLGKLFLGAVNTARKLGLDEGGYRLVVNNGSDGGQTVDYLHIHILGGRSMQWPPG